MCKNPVYTIVMKCLFLWRIKSSLFQIKKGVLAFVVWYTNSFGVILRRLGCDRCTVVLFPLPALKVTSRFFFFVSIFWWNSSSTLNFLFVVIGAMCSDTCSIKKKQWWIQYNTMSGKVWPANGLQLLISSFTKKRREKKRIGGGEQWNQRKKKGKNAGLKTAGWEKLLLLKKPKNNSLFPNVCAIFHAILLGVVPYISTSSPADKKYGLTLRTN